MTGYNATTFGEDIVPQIHAIVPVDIGDWTQQESDEHFIQQQTRRRLTITEFHSLPQAVMSGMCGIC